MPNLKKSNSNPDSSNDHSLVNSLPEKIEIFKDWSLRTLKITKQSLEEKFGVSKPSIDPELQNKIDNIRNTQRIYTELLNEIKKSFQYFELLTECENNISSIMNQLSNSQPELSTQFNILAYQHQDMAKSFNQYSKDLERFQDSLRTITTKSLQDTLTTIDDKFNTARLEYDYLLNEIKNDVVKSKRSTENTENSQPSVQTQEYLNQLRENYENLKDDVNVKIQLVNEHRIRVLKMNLYTLSVANRKLYFTDGTSLVYDGHSQGNVNLTTMANRSFLEVSGA